MGAGAGYSTELGRGSSGRPARFTDKIRPTISSAQETRSRPAPPLTLRIAARRQIQHRRRAARFVSANGRMRSRVDGTAAVSEHRRLRRVELTARGVEGLLQPDVFIGEVSPAAIFLARQRSDLSVAATGKQEYAMTFHEGPVDLEAMQGAQKAAPPAPNLVVPQPTHLGVVMLVSRERLEAPWQRVTVLNSSPSVLPVRLPRPDKGAGHPLSNRGSLRNRPIRARSADQHQSTLRAGNDGRSTGDGWVAAPGWPRGGFGG